jgi:hypothetical protein
MTAREGLAADFIAGWDWILACFSLCEFSDCCFSAWTGFDIFRGSKTCYSLGVLRMTRFLAGVNSTIEFSNVRSISLLNTFHIRRDIDRNQAMTRCPRCSSSGILCRSNESLWSVSHRSKRQSLQFDMADMVLGDKKPRKYEPLPFPRTERPPRHCNAKESNKAVHMTTPENPDRNPHT